MKIEKYHGEYYIGDIINIQRKYNLKYNLDIQLDECIKNITYSIADEYFIYDVSYKILYPDDKEVLINNIQDINNIIKENNYFNLIIEGKVFLKNDDKL